MEKIFKKSIFIFRRDLRLNDNIGLHYAIKQSELVIPIFIFDPRQVGKENSFASTNCIQFMIESIIDLNEQLIKNHGKLYLFHGNADEVIKEILINENIDALFCNKDYTPFSIARDQAIEDLCKKNKVKFITYDDALLTNPQDIQKSDGTPYSVFTPFYNYCKKNYLIAQPLHTNAQSYYTKKISGCENESIFKKILTISNDQLFEHGGTSRGRKILNSLENFSAYATEHNFPEIPTTGLSAHLKFGTISIRQTYYAICKHLGNNHPLLRQLYWRDFFTYIAYHSPHIFGHAYKKKYEHIWWDNDKKKFKAWCDGMTGFPIVDAGMRQMNSTGFMHNRVRMIVGSFLTKDLHIDWRKGEKYFAQKLIDYDPCVNNGNWQWVASTGADAQPYFRIFNPWLQQKKFDPHCQYIKEWIPELSHLDTKTIHSLSKKNIEIKKYPQPICDHNKESRKAKEIYKSAL